MLYTEEAAMDNAPDTGLSLDVSGSSEESDPLGPPISFRQGAMHLRADDQISMTEACGAQVLLSPLPAFRVHLHSPHHMITSDGGPQDLHSQMTY